MSEEGTFELQLATRLEPSDAGVVVERFVVRAKTGEATFLMARRRIPRGDASRSVDRIDSRGSAQLRSISRDLGRAFLADLGHPSQGLEGELKPFTFSVILLDAGEDDDGTRWREFKLEGSHGGRFCDAYLTVRPSRLKGTLGKATFTLRDDPATFWDIARLALADGVAPRDPPPAGFKVHPPKPLPGAEELVLSSDGERLVGHDVNGVLYEWRSLSEAPVELVDLERGITARAFAAGKFAAVLAAHSSTERWKVVMVDIDEAKVRTIVTDSDDFSLVAARVSLTPDGQTLTVTSQAKTRTYRGTKQVEPVSLATTHLSPDGAIELEATGEGALIIRREGSEVTHFPALQDDRRCIREWRSRRPQWLDSVTVLLDSDRLVALDLVTLQCWAIFDDHKHRFGAVAGKKALIAHRRGEERPAVVRLNNPKRR